MTWHTAVLCTAFLRTSSLKKVSVMLIVGVYVLCVCLVEDIHTDCFSSAQSQFVQWDKGCRLCVVPPRDRVGSSVATV